MSLQKSVKKITVPDIIAKKGVEKISALTAYDALFASILDDAGLDIILVGDSGAMVFGGHESTIPLTMDESIYHCKAVRRGLKNALFVADMPFMSYQINGDEAMKNAARFFKEAGVDAVKLEGGQEITETIKRMVDVGMPVMGHLGLTPQSIKKFGGYHLQAKDKKAADKLINDAVELEKAGAFSIVLEKIPFELADTVTKNVNIPTIGIGAGPHCDGQILVTHDMLGLFEKFKPKFVRRYAELGAEIRQACENYSNDIKNGTFPSLDESFDS